MNEKKQNSKCKALWLSVLILFICVAITTFVVTGIINLFLPNDDGAISLRPGEETTQPTQDPTEGSQPTEPSQDPNGGSESTQPTQPPAKPGFEAADDQSVWKTNTQVEIFKISYINGERVVTVASNNGDKIIAPGTENSYTFKLKNTGNVALDYTVEVEAIFTPADIQIPVKMRMSRYDGHWVMGGADAYVKAADMGIASDAEILGAGKYTYYTLDWAWPMDGGDDALDTLLGDLAAEQALEFTVIIRTTATESRYPNAQGGLTPPKTGDVTNVAFWAILVVGSFVGIIILLFKRKEAEAKDLEETQWK